MGDVRRRWRFCGTAARNDDWDIIRPQLLQSGLNHKPSGQVFWFFLIGLRRDIASERRTNHANEAIAFFSQVIAVFFFFPIQTACHQARGPGQRQALFKVASDRHRERRVDIEQHNDAGLVNRGVNDFPHVKRRVRIGKDCCLRPNRYARQKVGPFQIQGISFKMKRESKVVDQLHWV